MMEEKSEDDIRPPWGSGYDPVLQEKLEDRGFRHNFVDSLLMSREGCRRTARQMERQRDEARRLAIRIFKAHELTWQLYGEGPEIVAANPWLLEDGPWQRPK